MQYYSPSDLASYLKKYNVENQIPVVVGPNVASDPGGEASLDIQVMLGVAPGNACIGARVALLYWVTD